MRFCDGFEQLRNTSTMLVVIKFTPASAPTVYNPNVFILLKQAIFGDNISKHSTGQGQQVKTDNNALSVWFLRFRYNVLENKKAEFQTTL